MDNECSATLKNALTRHNIKWQLVPPKTHRRNAAERAIQTFKNHLKSGLALLDPQFPVREWDRILPQHYKRIHPLAHPLFPYSTRYVRK